jgi:hypothetical protein
MPPRSRLKIPDPHEISLVRRGANLKKFLVHKSDDGDAPPASDVLEQLIVKAAQKQGEDVPPPGAVPAKVKPNRKPPEDGDAPPGEANPDEQDEPGKPKAKVLKAEQLDPDRLWLLEFVAKELGGETRQAILAGTPLTAPESPTEDQAWVMAEVEKAFGGFGRKFGPPRRPAGPDPRMAQAMARQVPAAAAPPPGAAYQPAPPAAMPPPQAQAQHPIVQQGQMAPPVAPAADIAQPQLAAQLPLSAGGGLSSPAQDALKACARILAPHKAEITADSVAGMLDAIGIPTGGGEPDPNADGLDEGEGDENAPEGAVPPVAPQDSARQNLDGKPEYVALSLDSKTHHDEVDPMDLSAFPPAQRTQMETVLKSLAADANKELVEKSAAWDKERKELIEKNEAIEKRLNEERDQRAMAQYVAKAEEYGHLGADAQKLAKVLKALEDADPELRKDHEAVLKGLNGQIAINDELGGLMGETGSRQSSGGGSTAQAKLDQLADGYVAKDGEGSLSRAQKMARVLKSDEGKRLALEIDRENERKKRRFGAA